MNNFTCKDCLGVCCFNPPAMASEAEIIKAKKYGAKLVSVKRDRKRFVSIEQEETKEGIKHCPFLEIGTGGCKIYSDRFLACKNFKCKALNIDIDKFLAKSDDEKIHFLTSNANKTDKIPFIKNNVIKKHKIDTIGMHEALERVAMVPYAQAMSFIKVIEIKNEIKNLARKGKSN